MKALSKLKSEVGIWMTDVPAPELGHNDLLIKIRKTAICGTDMHIYNWDEWAQKTIPVPMVVGHGMWERWSPSARKCAASPSAIASPAKAISPAATAATAAVPVAPTCAATPLVWV